MDKTFIDEADKIIKFEDILNVNDESPDRDTVINSETLFPTVEEDEENNAVVKAEDEEEAASVGGETPVIVRLIGAVLCLVFCAVSVAFYADKAAKAADCFFSNGIEKLVNSEVFDGALTIEYKDGTTNENNSEDKAVSQVIGNTDNDSSEESTPPQAVDENNATYKITEADLSSSSPYLLSNETDYFPDVAALAADSGNITSVSEIYEKYGENEPCILIVHTHGTEAYSSGKDSYSTDEAFRTQDTSKNVVSVGDVMEATFRYAGVNVIHDRNMYDKESYRESYSRSFASVKATLEKNPSVAYVLDVHRDSIIDNDKTKYRPVFDYEGLKCAQMMIVVGTDEGGADHAEWDKNLSLALQIQKNCFSSFSESLARSINLRSAAFNQGLSSGSLLLEIGSCGNTLDEAKRCAVLTALSIAKAIGAPNEPDAKEVIDSIVSVGD